MPKWRSCAEWPPGHVYSKYGDNITRDSHDTKEQAEAVCKKLKETGLGGERCHFPVRTWVEPKSEEKDNGQEGEILSS